MELRSCVHLHFIQAIKGGSVTKVLNVACGRPTLSFKDVADIYDVTVLENVNVKAERSCISEIEERTVKAEPDVSVYNANDGVDQRIYNLDDDDDDEGFDNFTLKQIKEKCKTRKRKHSQGLDSSTRKIKIEACSSVEEDYKERQMAADDSDLMETLSSWRSKVSKNMKAKKRKCIKDPISTYNQEIVPVVKSEEIQNGEELPSSSWDSAALVEVPEMDYVDHLQKLSSVCDKSYACQGPNDYSIVAQEEADVIHEFNLENEFNYDWEGHADFTPLQMAWPSNSDIVVCNSELTSDQSPNFPAIEFESEECTVLLDSRYICPQTIPLVEDHNSDIYDNQPDNDTTDSLPIVATPKDHDCVVLGYSDDSTFLGDCRKDKFTSDDEVQAKISSVSEYGFNPGGSLVGNLNDSPEYEEKQSSASVSDDEERHVSKANNELTYWDEHEGISKLHRPKRLLSTRKAISPSSQEKLCKSLESVNLHHDDILECKGKLHFCEQTDNKKNGAAEGVNGILKAGLTDNPNNIGTDVQTTKLKRASHPRGIHNTPPRQATRLGRLGCNSIQSCSKSAIAFSKQQMHEFEWLAMKLTKELKSTKDIMDDMLRSEFCLNTSLRYKVNEARMAVKNATKAEETAKRCLSVMARDCSRFCMIMKLADGGPPAPQNVVSKERKKIAFADEAGGTLCQVKFYENDGLSLSESN